MFRTYFVFCFLLVLCTVGLPRGAMASFVIEEGGLKVCRRERKLYCLFERYFRRRVFKSSLLMKLARPDSIKTEHCRVLGQLSSET